MQIQIVQFVNHNEEYDENMVTVKKAYDQTIKMIKPPIDSKVITLQTEVDEYFQIQLYQFLLKSNFIVCLLTF